MAGPEGVSEGIGREGALIGLFGSSFQRDGRTERKPRTLSLTRPPALAAAAAAAANPLPSRAGPGAPLGAVFMPEPPPPRGAEGRDGTGRGAAGRGPRRPGAPAVAGGAAARGRGAPSGRCCGARAVAELATAAAGARLHGWGFFPPFSAPRFSQPALPSPAGQGRLPAARRCRQPPVAGRSGAPARRGGAALSCPAARGVSQRASLPVAAPAPLVPPREETLSPGTGFSAPAAAARLCGDRVTTPEAFVRADGAGGTSGRRRGAGARPRRARGQRGGPGPCPPRGGSGCEGRGRTEERLWPGGAGGAALRSAGGGRAARRPLGGGSGPGRGSLPPSLSAAAGEAAAAGQG